MKKIVSIILYAALGGALTLGAYSLFFENPKFVIEKAVPPALSTVQTAFNEGAATSIENTDFTIAADKTLNAVVHVKNTAIKTIQDPFAAYFYGQDYGIRKFAQVGMGSGVIISADGYIITNNHVIDGASDIEVTLNNKKVYKATMIGTDATNDIALLKIDGKDLPFIVFGDSENVKVGEWVLAVGNPYNLTSTVTAGIISAKGRDLSGNTNIDSFIQTDAAVNPGNSGGALVNIRGELIGINTAISSKTGSFVGYSFAVPSNIAKKVVEDIMEFGNVQKAILGVRGGELNGENAKQLNVNKTEGFYISEVTENSGAKKAGLKQGDIIIKMGNEKIANFSDLTGFLRSKRPGDKVLVTFLRSGEEKSAMVQLSKDTINKVSAFGLELQNISPQELKKLKIDNGVKINGVTSKEMAYYGIKKGCVIIAINGQKVNSIEQVNNIMENKSNHEVLRFEILNLNREIERYILR